MHGIFQQRNEAFFEAKNNSSHTGFGLLLCFGLKALLLTLSLYDASHVKCYFFF